MRRHLVGFLLLALATTALAQEPVNKFRINVANGVMTGTEEYHLIKSAEGFRLSGKLAIEGGGTTNTMRQEAIFASDGAPIYYKLSGTAGSQQQTIEAVREGAVYQVTVSAGGQKRVKEIEARPSLFLLDNLIVSHYQLLLNGARDATVTPALLVPQVLAVVPAKFTAAGPGTGTLDGKPVVLKKYSLEATVSVDIWADANNRLMRVYVPLQNVEIVREGFVLTPAPAVKVAGSEHCKETDVTFASDGLSIPGTLCVPTKATSPVPLVVFVHGSGPNDRDETIGPNKPFRDLAYGLAAHGIATLRYDKRTYLISKKLVPADPKATIEDEVLADAVAALKYAQARPETQPDRVLLLGHSLGGSMAPLIAERVPNLRGVLMLAAAGRPFDELLYEQIPFQLKRAGKSDVEIKEETEQLNKKFARVRSGDAKDDEPVFFASARYWRDLLSRDYLGALKKLPMPVMILRGDKDIQVAQADYDLLLKTVAAKPSQTVEARTFHGLNHLFMPVEGESTGVEYGKPSHVAPEVVDTIVTWITEQMAPKPAAATAR